MILVGMSLIFHQVINLDFERKRSERASTKLCGRPACSPVMRDQRYIFL